MSKRKPTPPPVRPPSGLFEWPAAVADPFPATSPDQPVAAPAPAAATPFSSMPSAPAARQQSFAAPPTGSSLSAPSPPATQSFGSDAPWSTPAWTATPARPATAYHPPPKKGLGVGAIIAIVIAAIVGVVVVIGVLSAVAIPAFLNQRAKADLTKQAQASNLTPAQLAAFPYCGAAVTPSMSGSTSSYVTALIAMNKVHDAFAAKVRSEGNVASLSDLNTITSSDNAFIRTVSGIKWSDPMLAARAQQVIGSVHNYDSAASAQALSQGATPSDDSDLRSAAEQRYIAFAGMRQALGLPRSTCPFVLPA